MEFAGNHTVVGEFRKLTIDGIAQPDLFQFTLKAQQKLKI